MVLSRQAYCVLGLILGAMINMAESTSCDEDEHCKPYQVCCGERCTSWPKCFLNSDKECYYDTHCVRGAVCVAHKCKSTKRPTNSCRSDNDCVFQKHSKSYDNLFNNSRCCTGKCFKTKSCLTVQINTTFTAPKTTKSIDSCWNNCLSGFECVNAKCSPLGNNVDASQNTEQKDNTLSRAGFLSAAILTSVVFLTIMCFCFLKETKYIRRHMERSQARESISQSSCANQHTTTIITHESPRTITPWMLFPGFNQTNRDRDRHDDCVSTCTGPPSYHSVCFDLPPSYDEVVNCRCESCEPAVAARTNASSGLI